MQFPLVCGMQQSVNHAIIGSRRRRCDRPGQQNVQGHNHARVFSARTERRTRLEFLRQLLQSRRSELLQEPAP